MKFVPVHPSTHRALAKLLFGVPMTRKELVKLTSMMAREAKDLTGCYPANESKQAKKRINRTLKALKLLIDATSDRVIAQLED